MEKKVITPNFFKTFYSEIDGKVEVPVLILDFILTFNEKQ